MQADILQLKNLERKFDIVESVGVLHHMNDPVHGLKILRDLLEPDGLLIMSICSFHPKESEETVKQFLNKGLNHYPEYYESLHESVERTDHGAYFYPHKLEPMVSF